ncbi:hypothetical protein [Mycoplasmopsis felis]
MTDSQGNPLEKVLPGQPGIITGLNYLQMQETNS